MRNAVRELENNNARARVGAGNYVGFLTVVSRSVGVAQGWRGCGAGCAGWFGMWREVRCAKWGHEVRSLD